MDNEAAEDKRPDVEDMCSLDEGSSSTLGVQGVYHSALLIRHEIHGVQLSTSQ